MGDVRGGANGPLQQQGNHAVHGTEPGEIAQRVSALVERCKALQDLASSHSSKVRRDAEDLSEEALTLDLEIKQLEADINSASEKDHISQQLVHKIEEDLYKARFMIYEGDVGALLPSNSNGLFLRLLLGPVNVRAPQNHVRLQVKEEYNSFRVHACRPDSEKNSWTA
eukprot:TRINITY_DN5184_c0_g3_i1.p1 TRINITY_DN5184_c0_g3~~TRINITY_DN5184_c0_g3_i1.p1  ORF type:complete len:168 (-),score=24.50 TRINITY_DN5184_c0_g3_i1:61-564(-)